MLEHPQPATLPETVATTLPRWGHVSQGKKSTSAPLAAVVRVAVDRVTTGGGDETGTGVRGARNRA
jgi:hypothetical protein